MKVLTVGEILNAIQVLPHDAPVFILSADGIEIPVADISHYVGCNGETAVSIQLDEEDEPHEMDDPAYDKNNPGY